jgi:hypothetical protein
MYFRDDIGLFSSASTDFSLCRGGPTFELARRLRLGQVGFGLALASVAWMPLLVLSLMDGAAASIPFFRSVGVHTRLLIAIPCFFLAEVAIDNRLRLFIAHLLESDLVAPRDAPRFQRALDSVARLRDSVFAEAILVFLAIALFLRGHGAAHPTMAFWWYSAVALPVFNFLLLRWLWRFSIWSQFVFKLSRLDLKLLGTHPDRAGGLGDLGRAQSRFWWLGFAISTVLAGEFAENMLAGNADLATARSSIIVLAVLGPLVFLGPLLCFSRMLLSVRQRDRRRYNQLAFQYTREGGDDVQTLADLGDVFERLTSMRLVPFSRNAVIKIALAMVLPMVPLLFILFPIDQIVMRVFGRITGT